MNTLFAFQHPFVPAVQQLSDSTNLTVRYAPELTYLGWLELVAWPLSLESFWNLTGHNSGYKFLLYSQPSKNGIYDLPVVRFIHMVPSNPKENTHKCNPDSYW